MQQYLYTFNVIYVYISIEIVIIRFLNTSVKTIYFKNGDGRHQAIHFKRCEFHLHEWIIIYEGYYHVHLVSHIPQIEIQKSFDCDTRVKHLCTVLSRCQLRLRKVRHISSSGLLTAENGDNKQQQMMTNTVSTQIRPSNLYDNSVLTPQKFTTHSQVFLWNATISRKEQSFTLSNAM